MNQFIIKLKTMIIFFYCQYVKLKIIFIIYYFYANDLKTNLKINV